MLSILPSSSSHMEYFPEQSEPLKASSHKGFWVKDNRVYDVTTNSHVRFMIENADFFEISVETIRSIYRKHYEALGTEGGARDELVRMAAATGWIRVRHYSKPKDYWSIQADNTEQRKHVIQNFILWAIENNIMAQDAEARIVGYFHPDDSFTYEWKDGGVKRFVEEST